VSSILTDLKYTKSHEWLRIDDDGRVTVGITEHAQEALGDLVFVELPNVEDELQLGDDCAVVESVKAASDVYAPVSGKIVAVNDALLENPQVINTDPYGDGWLFVMEVSDETELEKLLDHEQYEELVAEEVHA